MCGTKPTSTALRITRACSPAVPSVFQIVGMTLVSGWYPGAAREAILAATAP